MERPRPAERIVHDEERRFIPTDRHRREARVRRERLLREYRRRAAEAPIPAGLALTLRLWWALAATSAPERRLHHRSGLIAARPFKRAGAISTYSYEIR